MSAAATEPGINPLRRPAGFTAPIRLRTRNLALMQCPACGTTAPTDARFCPSCGQGLVARPDERRVATVLFADLVGFTSYSEAADPEAGEEPRRPLLRGGARPTCRPTAARSTRSSATRSSRSFGAPVAHEDDAERAVRAALQMQRTLERLHAEHQFPIQMRIGVNTGEVLVGALRAGGDYTAMGDVVNIASRLQTGARPVRSSSGRRPSRRPSTRSATSASVRSTVRGRDEPVEAWAAIDAVAPPGKRRRRTRTRLVGRDAEVALVHAVLDAAVARRRAHLVARRRRRRASARAASSARSRIARRSATTRSSSTGQCVPYGEDLWWPIAEVVRAACDVAARRVARRRPQPRPRRRRRRDRPCGRRHGHDAHGHRPALPARVRSRAPRPRPEPGPRRRAAVRADAAVGDRRRAGRSSSCSPTCTGPTTSCSPSSTACVDYLRARPFVLLATSRPELDERWRPAPGRHNTITLALEPLDSAAVEVLVSELLGEDASDRSHRPPARAQRRQPVLRRGARRAAARDGRDGSGLGGARPFHRRTSRRPCRASWRRGSTRSARPSATCSRTAPSSAPAARSTRSARSRPRRDDALDPDVALDLLAERDLIDARRRRVRVLVRGRPRRRLRDADQGRAGPPPRRPGRLARRARSAEDGGTAIERVAHHYGTAAAPAAGARAGRRSLRRRRGPRAVRPRDGRRARPRRRGLAQRGAPLRRRARGAAARQRPTSPAGGCSSAARGRWPSSASSSRRATDVEDVLDDAPTTSGSRRGPSPCSATSSRWRATTGHRSRRSIRRSSCGAGSTIRPARPTRSAPGAGPSCSRGTSTPPRST